MSTMMRFETCLEEGTTLDRDLANHIAHAVYQWALEQGATHFCHWFQPLTGATAEKHDGFIQLGGDEPIFSFSGSELIQSEPDASSFPNGGSRTTFEARGYTLWDPSSPIFLMERENGSTLCIPSTFVSYFGNVLDSKTPLLRSMDSLGQRAVALCHKLGETDVDKIIATAGPEQEYFLIDKAYAALRPDILLTGRSILGAPAPKGQSLDDHYFGSIPSRVAAFMHEVEMELYSLGIPVKTRHNEVAPCQFEVAVVYAEANIAADHNQLVMEMLKRVASRHDFHCSLHEKPFKGVNGSGKHLNWSLADNLGRNLLDPTKTPSTNIRFLSFLTAVLLGVHRNAGLLRAAIGTYSNDFRLGANEAPPAIISAFLGDQLSRICDTLASGADLPDDEGNSMLQLGVDGLPDLKQDTTDRNRTSPFAFTGNKFEFRAAGSSASVSFPLTCVNAAVADGIDQLLSLIDEKGDVLEAIREGIRQSNPIRFEGDNYSAEWVEEAERRGLPHYRKTPHSLSVLTHDNTVALFEGLGILSKLELSSQYHVKVEQYITHVTIEADMLQQLVKQFVLPAAIAERTAACADVAAQTAVFGADSIDKSHATAIHKLIQELNEAGADLGVALCKNAGIDEEQAKAEHLALTVAPQMEAVREVCDRIESIVEDSRWRLPKYREMLFQN
jgi:glutamine synthetase